MAESVIAQSRRKHRYQQIAAELSRQISSGVYGKGQALPSVRKLAASYGVSPVTARQAVERLRREGLVEIRQGAGTFVNERKADPSQSVSSVGLILSGVTSIEGWCFHLLRGLDAGIRSWNAHLRYYLFDPLRDSWPDLTERVRHDRARVLLMTGATRYETETHILEHLMPLGVPMLVIGNYKLPPSVSCVSFNLVGAVSHAVDELVKRGHRRLALLYSGVRKLDMNRDISLGFRLALRRKGLKYDPVMEATELDSDGYLALSHLAERDYRPTGLVMTERFVPGVLRWCQRHKQQADRLEVVTLTGSEDLITAAEPTFIMHLILPAEQLGYQAGLCARTLLENPQSPPIKRLVPFTVLTLAEPRDANG